MKWIFMVFALGLQLALAMKPFRGACPHNMTAMSNLNMQRVLGKWYIHSKYPPVPEKIMKCQTVTFKTDEGKNLYVEKRQLSSQTGTVILKKAQILKTEAMAGRYIQESHSKAFPEGIQIYILDTDYDNYAIRYMCFDANALFSFHWAVLQFRKRIPSAELVYKAQKTARASGIVISYLLKVPQNACPPDT